MRNNKEVKIYMTTQIRKGVLTDFDLNKYLETDGKLLTSKGLAKMLHLKGDAALRKQRSKGRSLFGYVRIGRQIYYPVDKIMEAFQKNFVEANIR